MTPQFEFNFSESGDDSAMREREERRVTEQRDIHQEISREWGLPIGERVEVWLRNPECKLLGRLEIGEPPIEIDRRLPLSLRIEGARFLTSEMVSCIVE